VVHGLAGGSISTWTHENGSCWLDWLPSDIPGIRIFVFGYRAQAVYFKTEETHSNDSSRVFSFAEDLCGAVDDARKKVSCSCLFVRLVVGWSFVN